MNKKKLLRMVECALNEFNDETGEFGDEHEVDGGVSDDHLITKTCIEHDELFIKFEDGSGFWVHVRQDKA
jgi:hypothetical protein